jgi:hypothetical protein
MTTPESPVRVQRRTTTYRHATFDNPINLHDAEVIAGMRDRVEPPDTDPDLKLAVLRSFLKITTTGFRDCALDRAAAGGTTCNDQICRSRARE